MARPLLDSETQTDLLDNLQRRHGRRLRDERFDVRARLEEGSVIVGVDLARHDRKFLYRTECAKAVPEDDSLTILDTMHLCFDFLDWYLGQYFDNDRELLLPLDWKPHTFGDYDVLARGDVRNPVLDDAADAWLRGDRVEV